MKIDQDFLELLSSTKINTKELKNCFLPNQETEMPNPQRAMWRAVITQALMDAGSNSKKIDAKREKARAIAWLNSDSEDFREVCELANLDPIYVREKSIEAIKNGCKWRVEGNDF